MKAIREVSDKNLLEIEEFKGRFNVDFKNHCVIAPAEIIVQAVRLEDNPIVAFAFKEGYFNITV